MRTRTSPFPAAPAALTLTLSLVLSLLVPARAARGQTADFVPDELLVKFDPAVEESEALAILDDVGTEVIGNFKNSLDGVPVAPSTVSAAQSEVIFTLLDVFWVRIVDGDGVEETIEELELVVGPDGAPIVLAASPNFIGERTDHQQLPDDLHSGQWNLLNGGQRGVRELRQPEIQGLIDADVDAPQGWNLHVANTGTVDCSSVVVGVSDSGIDLDNDGNGTLDTADGPGAGGDFGNAAGNNHWNGPFGLRGFWTGTFPPQLGGLAVGDVLQDLDGHGTSVASIIAARGDNGMGISGVCWRGQILMFNDSQPLGAGPSQASISQSLALATLLKAFGVNLRVINISGGSSFNSWPIMALMIKAAEAANILVVTSAGNDAVNLDAPARFRDPCTSNRTLTAQPLPLRLFLLAVTGSVTADNLICVAASDHRDALAGYSNRGASTVHLAAPAGGGGVTPGIPALEPGGVVTAFGGTSAAAPHVAAMAALGWSVGGPFADLSASEMKAQILRFVDRKPAFADTTVSGGRLRWPFTGDLGDLVPGGPAPPCGYETVSRETALLHGLAPSLCRGPVHLDTGNEWLGDTRQPPHGPHKVSNEHNAHAPRPITEDAVTNLPARDALDDGLLGFVRIGGVFHARLLVCSDHFGSSDAFGGRYGAAVNRRLYLNGFFDLNFNAAWDLPGEHVVHEPIDPTVVEPTHAAAFPVDPDPPPFPPREQCMVVTVPAPPGPGFPMRWRLDYGEDVGTPPPKAFAPFSYTQPDPPDDLVGGLDPNWPADRPLSIALHGEVEDYLAHLTEIHVVYPGESVHPEPVDTSRLPGTPPYTFTAVPGGTEQMDGILNDDLPAGLAIDPETGALTGAPLPPLESVYHVLCRVEDSEGRPVALLWWVIVVDDGTIPHLEERHVLVVGEPVNTGPVDTAQLEGTGPFEFFPLGAGVESMGMVSDALPAGLDVDPDTGALTGRVQRRGEPVHVLVLVAERATWRPVAFLWRTIVPIRDCNRNGVQDREDVASGASPDVNGNLVPDECEITTVACTLVGTAEGGEVAVTVSGFFATCPVAPVATAAGQSAATVAANLAAAINADACLGAQNVTAAASGGQLRVTGFALTLQDLVITVADAGLEVPTPVLKIPTLSAWGLAILVLLLVTASWRRLRRRPARR